MDVLAVVLLLIIIILIISNKASINQKFNALEFRIIELQNLLKQSERDRKAPETQSKAFVESAPVQSVHPEIIITPQQPISVEAPKPTIEATPELVIERQKEAITDVFANIKKPVKTSGSAKPVSKEPELSFFERYPDLEKFIGENLVNKIGIAILVLAIGFFVKYAIDNNWVGPVGRVGIGIVCGGILVVFAHRMRNNYKAFSSVLGGGGLAIFYFTITLAFQQFHLFSQIAALIILIGITVFAVTLSLLYDKQELAVIP